jgi:hypothetical protein
MPSCGSDPSDRVGKAVRSQVHIGVRASNLAIHCDLDLNLRPSESSFLIAAATIERRAFADTSTDAR